MLIACVKWSSVEINVNRVSYCQHFYCVCDLISSVSFMRFLYCCSGPSSCSPAAQDNKDHISYLNRTAGLRAKRHWGTNALLDKMPRPHTSTSAKPRAGDIFTDNKNSWCGKGGGEHSQRLEEQWSRREAIRDRTSYHRCIFRPHTAADTSPGSSAAVNQVHTNNKVKTDLKHAD